MSCLEVTPCAMSYGLEPFLVSFQQDRMQTAAASPDRAWPHGMKAKRASGSRGCGSDRASPHGIDARCQRKPLAPDQGEAKQVMRKRKRASVEARIDSGEGESMKPNLLSNEPAVIPRVLNKNVGFNDSDKNLGPVLYSRDV